ncbi:hypothetical protein GCM10009789_12010 [Kribbella sancticallisti]|uniref:Uncharacterized protein n=1 Tax=Kribbella sancticallisti TaxID=460087 RepID=A0ABN2CN13_9ACTN
MSTERTLINGGRTPLFRFAHKVNRTTSFRLGTSVQLTVLGVSGRGLRAPTTVNRVQRSASPPYPSAMCRSE